MLASRAQLGKHELAREEELIKNLEDAAIRFEDAAFSLKAFPGGHRHQDENAASRLNAAKLSGRERQRLEFSRYYYARQQVAEYYTASAEGRTPLIGLSAISQQKDALLQTLQDKEQDKMQQAAAFEKAQQLLQAQNIELGQETAQLHGDAQAQEQQVQELGGRLMDITNQAALLQADKEAATCQLQARNDELQCQLKATLTELAKERQEHSANAVSALSVRDDAPQSAVLHHQQALEATIAKYEAVKADLADHEQMQATLEQAVADAATATQQAAQVFQDQQREQAHSAALQQELDALKQELGGRLKDITNQAALVQADKAATCQLQARNDELQCQLEATLAELAKERQEASARDIEALRIQEGCQLASEFEARLTEVQEIQAELAQSYQDNANARDQLASATASMQRKEARDAAQRLEISALKLEVAGLQQELADARAPGKRRRCAC